MNQLEKTLSYHENRSSIEHFLLRI